MKCYFREVTTEYSMFLKRNCGVSRPMPACMHKFFFETEIDGTVYSVNTHFDSMASESLEEKAERIILKNL